MTTLDAQVGWKAESTYNTPVVVDRFLEFAGESLRPNYQLLTSSNRRPGQASIRADRVARGGLIGLTGDISFQPISKGFGAILTQACGTIATTGPAETTVYTHTGSITGGNLTGKSATIQVGRPQTDGTVQPFTYAGCKTGGLSLRTGLDSILDCVWSIAHAGAEATATALATAAYLSSAEVFSYVGGSLTVDAGNVPIKDASFSLRNNYAIRRFLGGGAGSEPLENADREVSASFTAEFSSMSLLNKVRADTVSAGQAAIVMTWAAPTIIGSTLTSKIVVTIPVLDVTGDYVASSGPDLLLLPISGVARTNSSNVIATIAYSTTDATP